jgi:DNA-binding response OmpR family regulator
LNGYDVCKRLREKNVASPILMLTAKGQEMDKVIGLDSGADDYVTKPFGVRELVARIHALLRRTQRSNESSASTEPFQIGANTIDPKRFELRRGKVREELTAKELKLLILFRSHPSEVLSRDKLLNEVWGYNYYGTTRTLDQVIVQLRKKLGDSGDEPKHLLSVHGVGYKLLL